MLESSSRPSPPLLGRHLIPYSPWISATFSGGALRDAHIPPLSRRHLQHHPTGFVVADLLGMNPIFLGAVAPMLRIVHQLGSSRQPPQAIRLTYNSPHARELQKQSLGQTGPFLSMTMRSPE